MTTLDLTPSEIVIVVKHLREVSRRLTAVPTKAAEAKVVSKAARQLQGFNMTSSGSNRRQSA